MRRIAFVSSAFVVVAGLALVIERSPRLSIAESAAAGEDIAAQPIDIAPALAAAIAAPLERPYSREGQPFADISIATVKPFESAGDTSDGDLLLATGSIARPDEATTAFLPGRGPMNAQVYLAELAAGSLGEAPAAAGFWPQWRSAHFREDPRVGTIENAAGLPVAPEALVQALGEADYVLLGETHDNPDHHLLQARMVERLGQSDRQASLVLEMVSADQAGDLEALQAEKAPATSYGKRLRWEERGWPSFEIYQPIFEAALASDMTIRAGDLGPALRREIGRNGLDALPESEQARLHLNATDAPTVLAAMGQEARDAHCGLMPGAAIPRMVAVQRARDAALADAMRVAGTDGPVVLIAGAGHVRTDRAVPRYLAAAEPDARIVSLVLGEVSGEAGSPERAPADYTLFTPRADISDRCAALRQDMPPR